MKIPRFFPIDPRFLSCSLFDGAKYCKKNVLVSFLNWATDREHYSGSKHLKFKAPERNIDIIYLTEDKLDLLYFISLRIRVMTVFEIFFVLVVIPGYVTAIFQRLQAIICKPAWFGKQWLRIRQKLLKYQFCRWLRKYSISITIRFRPCQPAQTSRSTGL